MRISDSMRLDAIVRQQGHLKEQYANASRVAATGAKIGAPGDNPVGAAQSVRLQGALDRIDAFRESIKTPKGDLDQAEGALATAGDLFARAGEIALQGANGSLSATDRASLASEVDALKTQLVDAANTKGQAGYLFGGTSTATAAMDAAGNFLGNAADRTAEIAPGVSAITSVSGALAFSASGGRNVAADLDALRTALISNNPAAIAATVSTLDASRRQILAARTDAGLKSNRLDTADDAHQQTQLSLSAQRHAVSDADPTAAYSNLIALQGAVEQAISVARTSLSTMSINKFG